MHREQRDRQGAIAATIVAESDCASRLPDRDSPNSRQPSLTIGRA